MKVCDIRTVSNGYVVTDNSDNEYIAKTLIEAAAIMGETVPTATTYISYAEGYNSSNLAEIRLLALAGKKISAIKLLRNCFTSRLGLLEAKEIVEVLTDT